MATISQLTLPVLEDGSIVEKTYDLPSGGSGTSSPESIGIGYATCSTAYATTAKVATLTGYNLTINGIVSVKFVNAVNSGATLNINGEGAKPIYYRNIPIVNKVIKAGDTATFIYDGTKYRIISIDTNWKASVQISGDENAEILITNSTYGISDTVVLDSDGKGVYIVNIPGTYTFSVIEE